MFSQKSKRKNIQPESEDFFDELSQQAKKIKRKKTDIEQESSIFKQLVVKSGFIPNNGDEPNQLGKLNYCINLWKYYNIFISVT